MSLRLFSALALLSLLTACQSSRLNLTPVPTAPVALNAQAGSGLRLSPALEQDLNRPDEESEPRQSEFNAEIARRVLQPSYAQAHNYYFTVLDKDQSSVEAILSHDGHHDAAKWVKNWRQHLGQNALWPDEQSTTYGGPWPALEHGLLRNGSGWFTFQSADQKAEEYYQKALKSWKPGLAPDHPDQAESWAWLGRTSHFLHDMTVPFHTMSLLRPAQLLYHSAYEKTCDELFSRYLPSRNHNPEKTWAQGPYPSQSPWGVYYPAGTSAAQMTRQIAQESRRFYALVNEQDNKGNWERSRAVMVPLGAKVTAGLVMRFLADVPQR